MGTLSRYFVLWAFQGSMCAALCSLLTLSPSLSTAAGLSCSAITSEGNVPQSWTHYYL